MSLLDFRKFYVQKAALNHSLTRDLVARFPAATIEEVDSHWRIPSLNDNSEMLDSWNRTKKEVLVIGLLSGRTCTPNGRSTDYIGPSLANGCAMACTYCYVARRKGYANPITIFANYKDCLATIETHVSGLGHKIPNQCDPTYWTYDIGCNSDFSVDSMVSPAMARDTIDFFSQSRAKASFATKYVNRELLECGPSSRKVRIRFSLMPHKMARLVDVRTSPISERIKAINDFYEAGYEVHLNFSPVIIYDGWQADWKELLKELDGIISPAVKRQLACEIIMLTHNEELHLINERWHPKGEEVLWRPSIQEDKVSLNSGSSNLRYKMPIKQAAVRELTQLIGSFLPSCRVRYAF